MWGQGESNLRVKKKLFVISMYDKIHYKKIKKKKKKLFGKTKI